MRVRIQPPEDPLIRALQKELTDQRTAGTARSPAPGRRTATAVHLNNWIDDGSKKIEDPSAARSKGPRIKISP